MIQKLSGVRVEVRALCTKTLVSTLAIEEKADLSSCFLPVGSTPSDKQLLKKIGDIIVDKELQGLTVNVETMFDAPAGASL